MGAFSAWIGRLLPVLALGVVSLMPATATSAAASAADPGVGDPASVAAASAAAVAAAAGQDADAEWVTLSLYDGSTLFPGTSFIRIPLDIPAAGLLTIRLQDLAFPVPASLLSVSLVRGGQIEAVLPGPGSLEFDISEAGQFFAFVNAASMPGVGVGSYYLDITHSYLQVIPLPAALWLLLSGIVLIGRTATLRQPLAQS